MLEKFKKLLGSVEAKAPEAVVEAAVQAPADASFSDVRNDIEAALGATDVAASLAVAVEALASMTANYEAAQAALNAITAEKAEMVVKAAAAKFAARKEKVELAVGKSGKSDALLAATNALDDGAFEAVVSALAGSVDAEAKTSLFTEVGATASADLTKIVEESSVMKLINEMNSKAK